MGFNLGEFLNLNNKKKLDESRGVAPASTARPKLTEQAYNQATDNYGRQLQQQVRSGQISNQDFTQKYKQALDTGQQYFNPAPFNPQVKAVGSAANVVKGTPASIWHTAALVPDAVRVGAAKATNNPVAATNAVKDYNQNYSQSLPNAMIDPFSRVADRISTGLPGGRNLQEANINLESATSDALRVATQAYKEGRISRDRYIQAYQDYADAANQAAQENARIDKNTSLKQGLADSVAVGSYALGGGKALAAGAESTGAQGIVGKVAGQFAAPNFERNLPNIVDRALFSKAGGVVGAVSTGARLGATTGLVNSLAQDNVTPGSIAKGTIEGAANQALFGAGMYGAGKVAGKVTTGLVPNITDRYNKTTDINAPKQDGYIQFPGKKQVDEPLYHGTPAGDAIRKEGFSLEHQNNARVLGDGVYMTSDSKRAGAYKMNRDGEILDVNIPKNAKILEIPANGAGFAKAFEGLKTNKDVADHYKSLGYDGIKSGSEIVVFDPKKVSVAPQVGKTPLKQSHTDYFNMESSPETISLDKLVSSKSAAENVKGSTNTLKFMEQAKNGETSKRNPIIVSPIKGGKFQVMDGNATFTAAQKLGWTDLPVTVVDHGQATNALNLVKQAKIVDPEFQASVKKTAEKLGLEYNPGPVKKFDRLIQKMTSDYGGDHTKIKDSIRGTVNLSDPSAAQNIIDSFSKHHDVVSVKNGYAGEPRLDGYRDVKLTIKMPNGHLGEVIIATPEVQYAKDHGGHDLYEQARVSTDAAEIDMLNAKMRKLYGQADADTAKRLASASDMTVPAKTLPGAKDLPVNKLVADKVLPSETSSTGISSTSKNVVPGVENLNGVISDTPSTNIISSGGKKVQSKLNTADLPIIGKKLETPIKKDILQETMSQVEGSKVKKPVKANNKLLKSFQDSQAPDSFKEALGAFTRRDETHTQKPNKELWATAQQRVYEDPVAALDFYHNNTSDDSVATGYALVNKYNKMGLTKEAGLLGADMAQRALEAGRTTQAYALMKMMTPEGIVAHTERQIARYNEKNPKKPIEFSDTVKKDLQARITEVNSMPDGQARKVKIGQMQQVIDDLFPTSIGDKAITIWKAGLLTSLRTHTRNIVGNTLNLSGEMASQTVGSPIDRLMSLRTGKRTNIATVRGLPSGAKEGAIIGKDIIKTGIDTTGSSDMKYNMNHTTWGKGIGGRVAKAGTDAVFRTLGAADKPFRQAREMNSKYSQGLAEAKNLGLTGLEKKAFIDKYVKETNQAAINEGEISTFANDTALGAAITKGKQAANKKNKWAGKAADIAIPFTQVPSAVAVQLLKYSPAGLAKGIYDVGRVMVTKNPELQRQASLAFGRGATGTAIMGAGALLMSKGLLTGDYPTDQRERAQWELEKKIPNSIMINGEWRSLNSIGPQSILMLAGAKAQQDHKDGTSLKDSVINSAGYVGKQFNDQTFVKGLSSVTDAFTDPKRKLSPYLQGQATSVIPNIVKDIAKASDPNVREVNSFGDKVKSSLPWATKTLTPKKDVFGKEVKRDGGAIGPMVDLFNSTKPQSTTTISELRRLQDAGFGATPVRIDKTATIGGKSVTFNSPQIGELKTTVGTIQKNAIVQLMNNPNYGNLPDSDKQNLIKDINNAIEPVENIRLAKKNNLLSEEQFNTAVASLSKAQKDYLLNGNIQAVLPEVKKTKEVDNNLVNAFSNSNNTGNTGLSVGKANEKTGNLSSADTKTYEEKLRSSQSALDFSRALNNNDLNKYSTLTTNELLRLETLKKSYDPNTEQDKINTVTKQQEALSLKLSKYKSQGYIKKVAKAKGAKVGKAKSYAGKFSTVGDFKKLRGSMKKSAIKRRTIKV